MASDMNKPQRKHQLLPLVRNGKTPPFRSGHFTSPAPIGTRAQTLYYRWSKEFLEAGKKRLAGHTAREATSDEVKTLRAEARQLKEALAEVTLENRLLKKA
jgi:transposase